MEPESKQNILTLPTAIVIGSIIIAGAILWSSGSHISNVSPNKLRAQIAPQEQSVGINKVKTDGEPFMGNPNAPVIIAYWYDYQCPFCKQNEENTMPQVITDYVNTGKAKVVFKDFQFLGQDSQTLGQFSRAVWDVSPSKFYQWYKAVYDNQGTENTGWATKDKTLSITTNVLGASDANKVAEFVTTNGAAYQKAMDADRAEGTAFGVNGTPGFIIGKQLISGAQPYAVIKQVIDITLAGK